MAENPYESPKSAENLSPGQDGGRSPLSAQEALLGQIRRSLLWAVAGIILYVVLIEVLGFVTGLRASADPEKLAAATEPLKTGRLVLPWFSVCFVVSAASLFGSQWRQFGNLPLVAMAVVMSILEISQALTSGLGQQVLKEVAYLANLIYGVWYLLRIRREIGRAAAL